MLKLEGLKLAPEEKEAALHRRAARLLRIPEEDVLSVQVLRRSIDAREELHLVYTVAAEVRQEKQVLRRCRDRRVSRFAPERYALPEVLSSPEVPPVVVGAGPGGLFAALVLARCGLRPILLERGRDTTARQRDVETFWRTGVLDPESNVQFGEGGAGAFSDGKLNTGTKDLRHRWILEELVRCGAPESILTDAKPHVGTDMLHIALQNLRQELLSLGAQVRFGHRTGEPGWRSDGAARPDRRGDVPSAGAGGGAGTGPQRTGYLPNAVRGRGPHGGQALRRGGPHRAPPAGHGRRPVPAVCGASVPAGLHL